MSVQVTEQDGKAVITIDKEDIHSLRVALQPIRLGEPTSARTEAIRSGLDKRLARAEGRL